jgi:hypothetical protein
MGTITDYVSGIGIKLSEDNINILKENLGVDDIYRLDISIQHTLGFKATFCGNSWITEAIRYYIFVPGENLTEINQNVPNFISKLKAIGVNIDLSDIVVVSDMDIS